MVRSLLGRDMVGLMPDEQCDKNSKRGGPLRLCRTAKDLDL